MLRRGVRIVSLVLVAALGAGCESSSPEAPDAALPYPNLSSPCRFQPSVSAFTASPETIRVGERATLTAQVNAARSWSVSIDPGSSGSGTLAPASGTESLRSEHLAKQAGEVVVVANGLSSDCGFSTLARTTVTVLP